MLRKLFHTILFVSCLLLSVDKGEGQNVLDGTYVKENAPVHRSYPTYLDLDHPTYIFDDIMRMGWGTKRELKNFAGYEKCIRDRIKDTIMVPEAQKNFVTYIDYYRKYYEKPPLSFDECMYFNPAFSGADHLIMADDMSMPEALRFYSVPVPYTADKEEVVSTKYDMKLKLNKPLYEILQPFYFKKTAITNKEYREFTDYVRDSTAHFMLFYAGDESQAFSQDQHGKDIDPPIINWKIKIDYGAKKNEEVLSDLYWPEVERFYKRKEINADKLLYSYLSLPITLKDGIERSIRPAIKCYPDTLAWVHDFVYSFMERMTNMYSWHPAFDDCPVVGITRRQAMAFLDWKTKQEQKKLNREGKGEWIVSYELPTEYEWEMVETADKKNGAPFIYSDYNNMMSDYSYKTDLFIKADTVHLLTYFPEQKWTLSHLKYIVEKNALQPKQLSDVGYRMAARKYERGIEYETEGTVLKADFEKNDATIKKNPFEYANYDCNGISFMGGNVSEWMQETYTDNWKQVFNYRHKILEQLPGKDAKYLLAEDNFFNTYNDTNDIKEGMDTIKSALVRGGNWFDSRYGVKNGKNTDGMNAKVFINEAHAHSTIGFRYVVKIRRKDEKQLVESLKANLNKIKANQ